MKLRAGVPYALCVSTFFAASAATSSFADAPSLDKVAAILVRALAYDRSLDARAGDSVAVAVLSANDAGSRAAAKKMYDALKPLTSAKLQGRPMKALALAWTDAASLERAIDEGGVDAICLAPGLDAVLPDILGVVHKKHVTTLTNVVDYVERGAAVAVTIDDGKPHIVINLTASRAEGGQLSSELVGLARVIR